MHVYSARKWRVDHCPLNLVYVRDTIHLETSAYHQGVNSIGAREHVVVTLESRIISPSCVV